MPKKELLKAEYSEREGVIRGRILGNDRNKLNESDADRNFYLSNLVNPPRPCFFLPLPIKTPLIQYNPYYIRVNAIFYAV